MRVEKAARFGFVLFESLIAYVKLRPYVFEFLEEASVVQMQCTRWGIRITRTRWRR